MKDLFRYILLFSVFICRFQPVVAQNVNNRGTEFWVGYGHHQGMESGNGQDMLLYFNTESVAARVKVYIYNNTLNTQVLWLDTLLPPNFVFATQPLPKAGQTDTRLFTVPCSFVPPGTACGGEGLFKRAILITSSSPIAAYAHIYEGANSGATMLLPVESWGHSYITANSKQEYATNCYSWMYVVAQHDSTWVEITPSQLTRGGGAGAGQPAGVPLVVKLNRGEIYQMMADGAGATKPEFTGTKIKTLANNQGDCFPIAVFAGSSRTTNPQPCGSGGGDNDNQQCFPTQVWGKRYLMAPTSSSNVPGTFMTNSFKIIVKDPTTVVRRNGVVIPQASLLLNSYYELVGVNTPQYIESDKPIMVAQFITGGGCLGGGPYGDPEMIYISPIEQGINNIGFFRNNRTGIQVNYLTLIIPNGGVPSLRIDGSPVFDLNIAHPALPGYRIIVKRWPAAFTPVKAYSDSNFVAITYGLGSVESYGFNAGTKLNNLNAVSGIRNVNNSSPALNIFNCKGSPVKIYGLFTAYQPTRLVWAFSDSSISDVITPNVDVVDNNPVFIDSLIINGIRYYRYECPGEYIFSDTGTIAVPVYATHPLIENCRRTELLKLLIRIAPKPDIRFSALVNGNTSGCIMDTAFFVSDTASVSGLSFQKWQWEFPDGVTSGARDTFRLFSTPGVKSVKLTGITTEGCLGDTTIDITIYDKPISPFTANPNSLCLGDSVILVTNAGYGDPAALQSWHWDFGNGQTITDTTPSSHLVTYANYGTYRVRHTVSVSQLCVSDTVPLDIMVYAKPDVSFDYPVGCLPANGIVDFTGSSSAADGQAIDPASYSWNFGDPNATPANPNTSTLQNPSHLYAVGDYQIRFSASTLNGCRKDTLINASFNLSPALDFPALNSICESSAPVSLAVATCTNGVPGTGRYSGPGTDSSGLIDPSLAGPGIHTILFVYTSTGGCKDSISQTIQILPKPAASFSATSGICENELATITDGSTVSTGSITSWNWYYSSGGGDVFNNGNPFTIGFPGFGNYTVKLVVVSDRNCVSDTVSRNVLVQSLPIVDFQLPAFVCMPNGTAQFQNTTVSPDGSPLSYQWDFGDGSAGSIAVNPSHVYTSNLSSATVTLTATSSFNCQSDTVKLFTAFFDKPIADFTVSPTTLCQGVSNIFSDNSTAPNSTVSSWDWDFGDGTPNATTRNPTHRYAYPGSFDIYLTVKNVFGCESDPFIQTVLVNLQPVVDAGWSFVVPEGTVIRLNPSVNDSSVVSFLWTPQGDISDPTVLRPVFAAMTDQVYTLTATGPGGCSDSDSMSVKILKPFKVPNVFSPNGDNINDRWVIKNLSDYPGVKVDVYNRYGQPVFSSVGYSQPWDGTYHGSPMPVGTYYYIIKPRNELEPVTGSVTIVR